jgi:hypothetical protein
MDIRGILKECVLFPVLGRSKLNRELSAQRKGCRVVSRLSYKMKAICDHFQMNRLTCQCRYHPQCNWCYSGLSWSHEGGTKVWPILIASFLASCCGAKRAMPASVMWLSVTLPATLGPLNNMYSRPSASKSDRNLSQWSFAVKLI